MSETRGTRGMTLRRRIVTVILGLAIGGIALYFGSLMAPTGGGEARDLLSGPGTAVTSSGGALPSPQVAPPVVVATWWAVNQVDQGRDDGSAEYDYVGYSRTDDRMTVRFELPGGGTGHVIVRTSRPTPEIVATRGIDLPIGTPVELPAAADGAADRIVPGSTWVTTRDANVLAGFSFFWSGSVPSVQSVVCALDLYDDTGVLVEHRDVPVAGPVEDAGRDGVAETSFPGADFPKLLATRTHAEVDCRHWQGEGFKPIAPVVLQREPPHEGVIAPFGDDTAYVRAELVWEGDPSVQIWRCDVTVRAPDGTLLVPPTALFLGPPPGDTGLPVGDGVPTSVPLEGVLRVPADLADVSAEVQCVPTNELDPAFP